jgi:hypothetical protein
MSAIFEDIHSIKYLKTVIDFVKVCDTVTTHEITHVRLHDSETEFAITFRKRPEPTATIPKEESPKPAPKKPVPKKPVPKKEVWRKEIAIGSRVVQISGKSPAVGVGTVTSILSDGRMKVKFFNHIKVLTPNNFMLADESNGENKT